MVMRKEKGWKRTHNLRGDRGKGKLLQPEMYVSSLYSFARTCLICNVVQSPFVGTCRKKGAECCLHRQCTCSMCATTIIPNKNLKETENKAIRHMLNFLVKSKQSTQWAFPFISYQNYLHRIYFLPCEKLLNRQISFVHVSLSFSKYIWLLHPIM